MANFDPKLLRPIQQNNQGGFDLSKLRAINKPQEQKGFGAVASDIADLPGNLLGGLADFAMDTVSGLPEATDQVFSKELPRAIGHFGSGIATQGKALVNLPYELEQYLQRKFGKSPDEMTDRQKAWKNTGAFDLPHIPEDTGLEKALGLDARNPGDVTLRNLGMLFAPGAKAAKTETAGTITGRTIKNLNKELEGADAEIASTDKTINAGNEVVEQHLKKGYEHGVPVAEAVTKKIEENKKDIGKVYNEVEEDLKNKNVEIPQSQYLREIKDEARNQLKNAGIHFTEEAEFKNSLDKMSNEMVESKGNVAPAAQVLSHYRTLRNAAQKLRSKAYSRGTASNKDLQVQLLHDAEGLEGSASNLEKVLESNNLGPQLDKLKEANARWRSEIVPLYYNSNYQTYLNKGYAPNKDIVHSLRGNGPGQQIIRDIIKSDPELTQHALGSRFNANASKAGEFDELAKEYIDSSTLHFDGQVKKLDEVLSGLKQEAKRKDLSLKKKVEIENQIKEAQEKRNKAARTAKRILKYGIGTLSAASGLGYLGHLVNKALPPVNQ